MKSRRTIQIITLLFAIAAGSAIVACASNEKGGKGRMQGPPPEAIEACSGKTEGESVTFTGRRGESLTATCQTINDQLVAVPEGHNRQRSEQE